MFSLKCFSTHNFTHYRLMLLFGLTKEKGALDTIMASTITRPGSAPCSSSKQEFDKQVQSEKIEFPLSSNDVIQPQKTKSFSSSSSKAPLQNLYNQAERNSRNQGLQIYDLGNGLPQPRYAVSPTYQNGLVQSNMQCNEQLPGNQWGGVQNYANLYLTRSVYDPDAQLPNSEEFKPMLPPKKQTSYGKVKRGSIVTSGGRNSGMSSSNGHNDEMDVEVFKGDNTILQVSRKVVPGQSSRNRAPLKVEEANELSSSFKSDMEGIQPRVNRGSLQVMNRSSRSVDENDTQVFHGFDPHQNNSCVGSDIKSSCRVMKYLVVLLIGLVVGAGVHALVKCWTKESSKK